jgi:7,8-dihydroneopterin aldolase/epimerase/oxygenase
VCEWITQQRPRYDATPLLETRANELLAFLFDFDKRVQEAWVGVYRTGSPRIGIERQARRSQFRTRSPVTAAPLTR